MDTKKEMIDRLQQNLGTIRKLGGWTTEELGEKIGVTKQTISNLENNKNPMNLTQYIALRTIFDYEIQNDPEGKALLAQALMILVDDESDIPDEKKTEYKDKFNVVAAAAAGGAATAALTSTSAAILGAMALPAAGVAMGPLGIVAGAAVGAWIGKVVKNKKKK